MHNGSFYSQNSNGVLKLYVDAEGWGGVESVVKKGNEEVGGENNMLNVSTQYLSRGEGERNRGRHKNRK